jgi:hypothetical protein
LLSELRDMHTRQRVEAEVAILNHDGKKRGTLYLGNDPLETAAAARETAERRFDGLFPVKPPAVPTPRLPSRPVNVNAPGPHKRTDGPARVGAKQEMLSESLAVQKSQTGLSVAQRIKEYDQKPHPYGHGVRGKQQ